MLALALTGHLGLPRVHTSPWTSLSFPTGEMTEVNHCFPPLSPSSGAWWGCTALRQAGPTMGPHHLVQEGAAANLASLPQLLHVAIVCAGHKSSRDVITLVKSMLFYRYSQVLGVGGGQEWGTKSSRTTKLVFLLLSLLGWGLSHVVPSGPSQLSSPVGPKGKTHYISTW